MAMDGGEGEEQGRDMVEIVVKTIGPGRPSTLRIPSPIKVSQLRRQVASTRGLPLQQLKLIHRGQSLIDRGDGEDAVFRIRDGDTLMVAVMPQAPARHLQEGCDDNDDEELKFRIPESTNRLKRLLFGFLQQRMRLPGITSNMIAALAYILFLVILQNCFYQKLTELLLLDVLLMALFSISLKAWFGIILWFLLIPIAHKWDLGPIYILGTGFAVILLNLGQRQHGDLSAYSIFNEDFRELPGTLNADRIDRDLRTGQF